MALADGAPPLTLTAPLSRVGIVDGGTIGSGAGNGRFDGHVSCDRAEWAAAPVSVFVANTLESIGLKDAF
jgi:hypothetical protein